MDKFTIESLVKLGYKPFCDSSGATVYVKGDSNTVVQKQQNVDGKNADNRPEKEKDNGSNPKPVAVAVKFGCADKRQRDIDGMVSTIMDCLVKAGALEDDNRFVVKTIIATSEDSNEDITSIKIIEHDKIIGVLGEIFPKNANQKNENPKNANQN